MWARPPAGSSYMFGSGLVSGAGCIDADARTCCVVPRARAMPAETIDRPGASTAASLISGGATSPYSRLLRRQRLAERRRLQESGEEVLRLIEDYIDGT
ncbi:MAG: hypothetical protein ACLTSX_11670 [Collinsella sp.]